ncbi:TonB-dependent receptor [Bacteroides sp.]|uniref:SusC/RagA family TonB-linked outer membrane protein n=1 Tax=Bacteroides sp. TaxID=29523 RepID=UPI0023BD36B2|nr:TonB-dependent receptor [Bacteroides sp.]MDE5761263.1 TonB-dependent receptor [Bacteroides sp.]MDE6216291.1 TonB-dependent receptor [Bacteroides sp.]
MKKKTLLVALLGGYFLGTQAVEVPVINESAIVQQAGKIQGTVVDETGEPIIGVTIQVKGKPNLGTITDVDGKFSINVSPKDVLTVSFIGFVTQEIKVGNQTLLSIKLKEDNEMLDEVVVTAFGTGQKKESVVGSIQTVRPSDLKVPSSNLSNSFAGRLSGVIAYQRSGQPGSNGSDFYIRGISTLSGMTSPLIILDGVEVSSADLNALDPEIIEGFSILKDATATAMYGTRGANGVMIVTTKSGADTEKPIIGVRVETNITTPTKIPSFVDGYRYMELYNEAVTSEQTGNILYTQEQINNTRNGVNPYIWPNVDWYGSLFNDLAFNQKANFNIRGGTKKITYFMNVGVNHETGMLKNEASKYFSYKNNIDLMKYTFQNNIDFHMSKSSTISLHLNVQLNDLTQPNTSVGNLYGAVMNSNPVDFPIAYPADGVNNWVYWGAYAGGNDQGAVNPMASLTNGYQDIFESTVMANIDFEQKLDFLLKGLRFKALFSFKNYNKTTTSRSQGINRYTLTGYEQNPDGTYNLVISPFGSSNPTKPVLSTSSSVAGDRRIYFQSYLDYNQKFGDHNVSGMALWNIDQYDNNAPGDLVASLPRRKMGFAGRLSYDYGGRYLMEVNAGYNGSENFAKGHKWGFFPSVAVGWNVSQESFFEPMKDIISSLKLRASYGLVGNDQLLDSSGAIIRFIYMSDITLQSSGASFTTGDKQQTTLNGPVYTRYQNNDLTWEVGEKLNVGFDMQLFNSLNINMDIFREIRRDIFQQRYSIPNYLGTASTAVYGNLAKVKNSGFDLSIDYGKQFNKDLAIQFKGTFTYAHNKILEYDEAPGVRPALSNIGKKLNTIYGYVSNGLYIDRADIENSPTSTLGNIAIAPGDIKYLDQPDKDGNYDGKITSDDRVAMGYPTVPEIVYGFGPSISYKNWDFSFFFQGVAHTSLMMSGFAPFGTQYNRNVLSWIADDYWSETNQNPNASYPRLTKNDNNHNTQSSDYWLRNGAFLKLKNAEIGYTYKKARFYISGINLLTFSPFKLWDPEMGGGKGLSYPTQRTFNVGFQLSFK